ncbi:hypothetical protein J6590_020610 [Homalodisca vitripennis]|nr:hypothetical protein J6590_020610 [Homalodisca vitripennis]
MCVMHGCTRPSIVLATAYLVLPKCSTRADQCAVTFSKVSVGSLHIFISRN